MNRKLVRYRIKDNFFDFWFKFIYSKASLIEMDPEYVISQINEQMPIIISKKIEDITTEIIKKDNFMITPTEIGRWWNRTGEEIDIVAVDERTSTILFVEIKWTNKTTTKEIIIDLKRKSELVQWRKAKRKENFLIISKSGFTKGFLGHAKENDVSYWDFSEIERRLRG